MLTALLYNIWRLTDFLLKVDVDEEMDYTLEITAGMFVEMVSSALVPSLACRDRTIEFPNQEWQHYLLRIEYNLEIQVVDRLISPPNRG